MRPKCGRCGEPFQRGTRARAPYRRRCDRRLSAPAARSRPSGAARKQALSPPAMARIAFLGLGVMGAPMARHLAAAGHDLTVYNRSPEKAEAWVARAWRRRAPRRRRSRGGRGRGDRLRRRRQATSRRSPTAAFAAMREGALFIDHTTVSARLARRLAEEARRAACSASTRRSRAARPGRRSGKLAIMCGGSGRGDGRGDAADGGLCRAHRPCRPGRAAAS